MQHHVVMPQLGLTMTGGSVSTWLKKSGEPIRKGEPLFSVETDKVEMEVEATASGFLAGELLEPQKVVPVGTVIGVIVDSKEEVECVVNFAGQEPSTAALAVAAGGTRVSEAPNLVAGDGASLQYAASPLAKRLSKELGVDLREVTPAKGIRISAEDVHRAAALKSSAGPARDLSGGASQAARAAPAAAPGPRAVIANRVSESFLRAPHFYLGVEIDATELVRLRNRTLSAAEKAGVRITYTDFFLRAIARAIAEEPSANAFWSDGSVVSLPSVDVAFVAQAGDRLLVPVIRRVDQMTMLAIARERERLTEKARHGKLTLPEMEGGSATLSNLGASGIDWFNAILNPPQSIIVATGRIARRPYVVNDALAVRDTLTITASIDHRVLDGVAGARVLTRIRELLEDPAMLLL